MPKILIFEDDKFLTDMYAVKFHEAGFEVAVYSTPSSDPVQIVLKEKPDIISMDVIMPDMDGFEATMLIKADPRTRDIPLYFLTTLGQQQDIDRGLQLGATEYLVKATLTPSEVVERVVAILRLHKTVNGKEPPS